MHHYQIRDLTHTVVFGRVRQVSMPNPLHASAPSLLSAGRAAVKGERRPDGAEEGGLDQGPAAVTVLSSVSSARAGTRTISPTISLTLALSLSLSLSLALFSNPRTAPTRGLDSLA